MIEQTGQTIKQDSSGFLSVPGGDSTNNLLRTGRKHVAGSIVSGADGNSVTGLGVLTKLAFYNGSGADTTVVVYDGTSAAGTKMYPTIKLVAGQNKEIDLAIPFSVGVFFDFATATSCEGQAHYEVMA